MPTESAQSVGEGKKNSKLLLCARLYKREGHFIKASEETCKKSIALTSLSTYKETGWEAKYPAKAHSWKVETQDFNPYSSCAEQTQVKDKELCWESWSKSTQERHTTLQSMRTKETGKSLTQDIFVSVKARLERLVFMDPFEGFPKRGWWNYFITNSTANKVCIIRIPDHN